MQSLFQLVVRRLRALTNHGLRRLTQGFWILTAITLVAAVYVTMRCSYTATSVSTTLELMPKPAELADDMIIEQYMLERLSSGESLSLRELPFANWLATPYSGLMAPLFVRFGLQALSLFNAGCSLLLMLLVRDIGMRIWASRSSTGKLLALASGDVGEFYDTARAEGAPPDDDWTQGNITLALFGVIVMALFVCNPIIFGEAIRPGPRPFAYLLSTAALSLCLRVLDGKAMPRVLCLMLIVASGLIHLPAALVAIPVVIVGFFGGAISAAKPTWLGRLKGNGRKLIVAAIIAGGVPMMGSLLSHFELMEGTVAGFLKDHLPSGVFAALTSFRDYCSAIAATFGTMMVNYAPQLALISLVPWPNMKNIVERTLLVYGAGLLAFFALCIPDGPSAQLYPLLVPGSIIGAIGVVGALQAYVSDAIGEVTRLWLKFFAVMAGSPLIGSFVIWLSNVKAENLDLLGQRLAGSETIITPYTIALISVAVIGLSWQLRKFFISKREPTEPEPTEPEPNKNPPSSETK